MYTTFDYKGVGVFMSKSAYWNATFYVAEIFFSNF